MSAYFAIVYEKICTITGDFLRAWDQFFFAPIDMYNISLFRCLFGIAIFFMYLERDYAAGIFFMNHGIVPVSQALAIIPRGYKPLIPLFFQTDRGIQLQLIAQQVLIALFTVGAFGRSLTWLLFLVSLGLSQRNFSIVYGADLFANCWLFYLSFVDHNQNFSIWNLLKGTSAKAERVLTTGGDRAIFASDTLSSFGVRLLQIQLCISYAFTGFEKLKGIRWWEGTAVWYVIGMEDLIPHDLAFMKHYPVAIAVLSMATVIFEVYFIFAVWSKKLRYPWLFVGFLFHLGTAIFMGLWYFFFVMTAPYLLFLPSLRGISLRDSVRFRSELS